MPVVDFATDTIAYPGFKNHWGLERYVFTRQTEDHDQSGEADDMDATTWGTGWENMLPGQQKASTKITGVHTGTKAGIGDILRPLVGRTIPVRAWAARESLNALAPVEFQPCSVGKYSVKSARKDVVKFDSELKARGDFNNGFILVSPKSNTQMATTGNGLSDINTVQGVVTPTSYGGVAQMHLYDIDGGTTPSLAVVVQHSVDGSVWTTLASFTVATVATATTTFVQRVRIPTTTTVNAYVRAQWTPTGVPTSVQGIVMFARGIDPDA